MTAPLSARPPWKGKRVVLGITGGIAAYKAVQLARDLTQRGAEVDVVMTRSAREFVGPLSFAGVTGRSVHDRMRSGEGAALHLSLAAGADLVLVAPATADFLARAAQGRADDLLATILLATRAPVLLAPAMNDRMYSHPQTQRNVAHCRDVLGYAILGPGEGPLAVGEGGGPGRMLEPHELLEHVGRALGAGDLRGRSVLVTAGPTREAVDPVRFLGNRSSGRMGFALAREAFLRGGDVTLVTGPSTLEDPTGVRTIRVESAREMLSEVRDSISHADIVLYAAAVADFRPAEQAREKIKRGNGKAPSLELAENPDVAIETLELRRKGSVALGFALETDRVRERALEKLRRKGFDLIVSNDPGEEGAGFDVLTNRVNVYDRDGGEEELPLLTKEALAAVLLDRVEGRLGIGRS